MMELKTVKGLTEKDISDVADQTEHIARTVEINSKVARLLQTRLRSAQEHFVERCRKAVSEHAPARLLSPWELWTSGWNYALDWTQRLLLFWDTMRQRGNTFIKHERAGCPPVLHFKYETVLDARKFERPVNYALVRILPPAGVTIDPKRRPYVILDPRAGHGPGIGGFKDDSQVGAALRAGHPVYFIIFFPQPEPGQTLLDVTAAEQQFVRQVRELHPHSPKPVLIGNCQGGWAAMMVAGSNPEDIGPIVIAGAPMSYWGGAWSEGEGNNPMRYSGGLLGGTWLASLTADLGNGLFDGAWLVQNFENLNPANSLWDKYYNLFANVDTEPPRFLDFERYWGGFSLMNRNEIEWITQNLFIGNKLWSGQVRAGDGHAFDLRQIRSPIVLFASLGDNITPPQQAFNWVADVYKSTDEIKANGQVIVGLLHQDIGHLGIFVSGRVAKKEYTQIVSVLKSIESLAPGLYGMEIRERDSAGKGAQYDVEFVEVRLEDIAPRLNRFKRADEKPFMAVEAVADFNQRAYELFARPLVQAMTTELSGQLGRIFHPLRVQHWAISNMNPWLAWLAPAAEIVKAHRKPLGPEAPLRQLEAVGSELISASLDCYREVRDAVSEALFYQTYGNLFSLYLADQQRATTRKGAIEARQLPIVNTALADIAKGGYPEALGRVLALLARHDVPLPLSQLELIQEIAEDFADLLPRQTREQERRIRGEQDIIVLYEPARALETLPLLVAKRADRARLRRFLDRLLAYPRLAHFNPTPKQLALVKRIREMLSERAQAPRVSTRKSVKPKAAMALGKRRSTSSVSPPRQVEVSGAV
jgi:pimeloyl-ACP methyl ester carboxylesterase